MLKNFGYFAEVLKKAKIENPWREVRLFMAEIKKCSYEDVLLGNIEFSSDDWKKLEHCIQRRADHEPFSKIIGKVCFGKHFFLTTKDTLDPRPESEILVEAVFKYFPHFEDKLKFLDLGTGTGCLLLSCLAEYENAEGIGVDQSEKALKIAFKNAENLQLQKRAIFVKSFWNQEISGVFDIILANPPYIPKDAVLSPEVLKDPAEALFGGSDGLQAYREIFSTISQNMHKKSKIFMEIGINQAENVIKIAKKWNFDLVEIIPDWQKIPRVLVFQEK